MKITAIAIVPPTSAEDSPKATPELLASCLAKYSRSNEGLETIMGKIDWDNPDKSVDAIFKMIDYGHASIGGLTGSIPIAIDGLTMFAAYKIFDIAQLVDGQESSTRYIKLDATSLPDPREIGIPEEHCEEWTSLMTEAFSIYNNEYNKLDRLATNHPELTRIPEDVSPKVRERMLKNYALDRARYYIPFATKTSAAYIMNAREWSRVIKMLASFTEFPELVQIADECRKELSKFAPRLVKHTFPDEASLTVAEGETSDYSDHMATHKVDTKDIEIDTDFNSPFFPLVHASFVGKKDRYSFTERSLSLSTASYKITGLPIAELRDLNRHRSGSKIAEFSYSNGFYVPEEVSFSEDFIERLSLFNEKVHSVYTRLLGNTVDFTHMSSLDKIIYEIELRTGLGAHFVYSDIMTRVASSLIDRIYAKEGFNIGEYIILGKAEPE